jgi:hypothetical protein
LIKRVLDYQNYSLIDHHVRSNTIPCQPPRAATVIDIRYLLFKGISSFHFGRAIRLHPICFKVAKPCFRFICSIFWSSFFSKAIEMSYDMMLCPSVNSGTLESMFNPEIPWVFSHWFLNLVQINPDHFIIISFPEIH